MNMAFRTVSNQLGRLKAERDRYTRTGAWVAATIGKSEKARAFCEREGISLSQKAQGEGSNIGGAFSVPEELEDGIMAFRSLAGVARREADNRTMGSDVRAFPRRVSGPTASIVGEGQAGAESESIFDSVTVSAKKGMTITRVSSELFEDSLPDLGAWFTAELGFAFANLEDDCAFNADGSTANGRMLGVTKLLQDGQHVGAVTAAATHDSIAKIDSADLGNLVAALPEQFLPGAKWYCSAAGVGALIRLGAAVFGMAETATGVRPLFQYGGHEIVPTPKLPGTGSQSGKMLLGFGDLRSAMIMGTRKGVTVKTSSSRYMERDQIAVRATSRFETIAHNMGDASKAGALVGLLGA